MAQFSCTSANACVADANNYAYIFAVTFADTPVGRVLTQRKRETMREKLTDSFARAVKPTPKIERYFDTDRRAPRGFLVRVTPAGARTWAVRYRLADTGREREISIGSVESWPIAEAWKRGHELRREVDTGGDPLANREKKRQAKTVAQLAERFIEEALSKRAPRTQLEYRAMLRDWILPALGRLKVDAVAREDVERLHRRITAAGKTRRANAVKSLVSTLFNQAIVWGMLPPHTNPADLVEGNKEHGRERYLKEDELERLMTTLERWGARRPDSVDIISLAVLTGARRGEILGMHWDDVDLDKATWSKPASTTKQRKPHHTVLPQAAVALLKRRQDERQPASGKVIRLRATAELGHVFRGAGSKTAAHRLERDWYVIRAAAGLDDVRFHDLRHSYASLLVGAGVSLPIIGRMLGHSKPATTQRYAHLADEPLHAAAKIIGDKVRPTAK
jgi:integrase